MKTVPRRASDEAVARNALLKALQLAIEATSPEARSALQQAAMTFAGVFDPKTSNALVSIVEVCFGRKVV
jgi:hypothetical protein